MVTSALISSGTRPVTGSPAGFIAPDLEMMMPQHVLLDGFDGDRAGGLDLADARRRPEVVDDAVGPAEAGGGDDFFVVDALVAIAGFAAVLDVPLAGIEPSWR